MIFLFTMYIFFILFIASMTFDHSVDNTSLLEELPFILGFLAYILPILIGIMLIGAMLKPLFARPASKRFSILLSRKKEHALFAFVEKVCRSIGSKIPANIEVDFSVNAYVKYRHGLIGFLEDDLMLTIGLPMIPEMTTTEFTSLLAHEFGHFTQKIGMRLYYIITSFNSWFDRVATEQDEIDQKMALLAQTSGIFFARIILPMVKLFIWLARKILIVFMLTGHNISKFFTQQMESDANQYAIRLAGSEAFESSQRKLRILNDAVKEAFSQLRVQKKPSDNSLPDDFVLLVSSMIQRASVGVNSKTSKDASKDKTEILDTQPDDKKILKMLRVQMRKRQAPPTPPPLSSLSILLR